MTARRRVTRLAAGGLLALALGGCSLSPPGASEAPSSALATTPATAAATTSTPSAAATTSTPRPAAALAQARRTHEYPTPTVRQSVVGGWRSPGQAAEVFAATYVNWSARTVVARLRGLAQVSVGQARSAMSQAAAEIARDQELRRGGIANSGTIEAIAPVAGQRHRYVVVTRERTTAARDNAYRGLAPAWHVSVATVTRMADGLWVVSGWQPEN